MIVRRCARWHRGVAAVAAIVVGAFATAAPATAHSETGVLGIEVTPGASPRTANVRVLLEFSGDRHVVPGATVVAAATGPNGAVVPETPMTDRGDGRYEITLTMPVPGTWTVTATAAEPAATATSTVVVTDDAPPTTTSTTRPTGAAGSPSERAVSRTGDGGNGGDGGNDDDGSLTVVLIGAIAVAAAAVGAVVLARRRGARH